MADQRNRWSAIFRFLKNELRHWKFEGLNCTLKFIGLVTLQKSMNPPFYFMHLMLVGKVFLGCYFESTFTFCVVFLEKYWFCGGWKFIAKCRTVDAVSCTTIENWGTTWSFATSRLKTIICGLMHNVFRTQTNCWVSHCTVQRVNQL